LIDAVAGVPASVTVPLFAAFIIEEGANAPPRPAAPAFALPGPGQAVGAQAAAREAETGRRGLVSGPERESDIVAPERQ